MERVWRHGSPVFRSSLYGMSDIVVATDFASIEKVMGSEHVLTEWFQVRRTPQPPRPRPRPRPRVAAAFFPASARAAASILASSWLLKREEKKREEKS